MPRALGAELTNNEGERLLVKHRWEASEGFRKVLEKQKLWRKSPGGQNEK